AHCITKSLGDAAGPVAKLGARPFEAMILVAKLPRREAFEACVVFDVWRRQYDRLGFGELEQHSFKSREPCLVQVFYNLDYGRGVESGEAFVAVHQRTVQELYSR